MLSEESTGLTEEVLAEALAAAKARSEEMEQRLVVLRQELDGAKREVGLLAELLAVRRGEPVIDDSQEAAVQDGDIRPSRRRRGPHPAVVAAIAELEKAGRPLHISELMEALQSGGVTIPGAGEQANLIAHITREPQIVRPSRGMYALASWGIEEKPKVKPKVKPAVRRRVRGTSKTRTRRAQ